MPTNEIVGWIFAAFCFAGLPCVIYGGGGRNNPKPVHPKSSAAGLMLIGFGMLQFGLTTNYYLDRSARPAVTGTVLQLIHSGGRSPSSSFTLLSDSGQTVPLHTKYTGPNLVAGESARIVFMEYDHQVLALSMLSGASRGWNFQESDGLSLGYILALIGLLLLFQGWRTWPREDHADA